MAKTIKEIADELGVDKQKVYRFIKQNRIQEAHHETLQKSGVKYYDEAAEILIKQGIFANSVSSEARREVHQKHINEADFGMVIDMLKKELDLKNEQIRDLNARLSECSAALVAAQQTAQAAQALHAGSLQKQMLDGEKEVAQSCGQKQEKKGWIRKIFRL